MFSNPKTWLSPWGMKDKVYGPSIRLQQDGAEKRKAIVN